MTREIDMRREIYMNREMRRKTDVKDEREREIKPEKMQTCNCRFFFGGPVKFFLLTGSVFELLETGIRCHFRRDGMAEAGTSFMLPESTQVHSGNT